MLLKVEFYGFPHKTFQITIVTGWNRQLLGELPFLEAYVAFIAGKSCDKLNMIAMYKKL